MLVATKSFEYRDPWRGRCEVTAGRTQVAEGHELAIAHPDCFKPASERDTALRFGYRWSNEPAGDADLAAHADRDAAVVHRPREDVHDKRPQSVSALRSVSAPAPERPPWALDPLPQSSTTTLPDIQRRHEPDDLGCELRLTQGAISCGWR